MITTFKKIFVPTQQKIIATIIVYFVILFLGLVLVLSGAGAGKATKPDYITFFMLILVNPGIIVTPLVGMLFVKQGQIDPLFSLIVFGLSMLTFPYRDFSEYAWGLADDTP